MVEANNNAGAAEVVQAKKVKLLITGNVNGEIAKLYQLVDNI